MAKRVASGPKAELISSQKARFLEELRSNGGNLAKALIASGLPRRTAYDHRKKDRQFDEDWRFALEFGFETLLIEARRRALSGEYYETSRNGRTSTNFRKASDKLLIHLLKRGEYHQKWEGRVAAIANAVYRVVSEEALEIGIRPDQVEELLKALLTELDKIPTD